MKVLAVTLMLCVCYQLVARLGVLAWYEINKEYVATVLCENKDKPEMKCCGKCYLRKQLNNTSDNTENAPGKQLIKWEKLTWVAVLPETKNKVADAITQQEAPLKDYYKNLYRFTPIISIFHPPAVQC